MLIFTSNTIAVVCAFTFVHSTDVLFFILLTKNWLFCPGVARCLKVLLFSHVHIQYVDCVYCTNKCVQISTV